MAYSNEHSIDLKENPEIGFIFTTDMYFGGLPENRQAEFNKIKRHFTMVLPKKFKVNCLGPDPRNPDNFGANLEPVPYEMEIGPGWFWWSAPEVKYVPAVTFYTYKDLNSRGQVIYNSKTAEHFNLQLIVSKKTGTKKIYFEFPYEIFYYRYLKPGTILEGSVVVFQYSPEQGSWIDSVLRFPSEKAGPFDYSNAELPYALRGGSDFLDEVLRSKKIEEICGF